MTKLLTKLLKHNPAVMGTGIVTMIATFMYVAPSMGIGIPDTIAKVLATVLYIAGAFGIRSAVRPLAKDTPAPPPHPAAPASHVAEGPHHMPYDKPAAHPAAPAAHHDPVDKIKQAADKAKRKLGH